MIDIMKEGLCDAPLVLHRNGMSSGSGQRQLTAPGSASAGATESVTSTMSDEASTRDMFTISQDKLAKGEDVLREGPKSGNNKEGASNLRHLMIQAVKEKEEKLRLAVQLEAQVRSAAPVSDTASAAYFRMQEGGTRGSRLQEKA